MLRNQACAIPMPRRVQVPTARPALARIVTNCADALTTSLTKGSGDHGDLTTWCPDLGADYDHSSTTSTTSTAGASKSASTYKDGVMRDRHGQEHGERQILADITNATGMTFTDSERGRGTERQGRDERERGWRKFVKYFSPSYVLSCLSTVTPLLLITRLMSFLFSWFTVTMGTGIVSILLNQFPYQVRWLYWLSVIVFVLNLVLFIFFLLVSILRGIMWSETWSMATDRPKQRLFIGCIPTTMSTIVNMMVLVCVPAWGEWVVYTAWGCVFLPHIHRHYLGHQP